MKIGNIDIDKPLILAPMDEVSDKPFRLVCKELGADIFFSEFASSEALIRDVPKAFEKIRITKNERPFAIQIFGYQEESMQKAAEIVESFEPDFIDINCGCSVRKHVLRGECAGLLKDLKKMESIISAVVKATRLPVTVKTRLGWSQERMEILNVAKMVEQCGAKALTVHCRTRCQGYRGHADWTWLEKIKKIISIPLIGNGDVTSAEDVAKMFETGCDGVMIGRGAIANPWIFKEAKHYLKTGTALPLPSINQRMDLCIKHLKDAVAHRGNSAIYPFRKHYIGYIKGLPHVSSLRSDLMQLTDVDAVVARLQRYVVENSDKNI